MTNSVLDREDAPKHFPKSNLHQKKVMVTVWSSLASLIHYSFLNPGKIITSEKYAQQINEMYWKWQHLQQVLTNRMDPILLCDNVWLYVTQPMLQKLNGLVYEVLLHLPYSLNLPLTDYHFFKHLDNFLQGKCFHNQLDVENAFQEFIEFRSMDFFFFAMGINKHFSLGKMCWL